MAKKSKNRRPSQSDGATDCQADSVWQPPPEVVEFCRIIAGVLRRNHHNSLVDEDCVEKRRQDQFEISELKEYECE